MGTYLVRHSSRIIQDAIRAIFDEQRPRLTVRQVYYALTVLGVVPKTEQGYRKACYQLGRMREQGLIPYGWIADNTRWQIKPDTDSSLEDALTRWQRGYRRDLWINQADYVEIWIEKDALAGVVSSITLDYDVPLYVCRGYSSTTFLYEASEYLKTLGKPAYIYHFGDFDPSGVDAAYKVRDGLAKHGAQINFERMAVTPEQITQWRLPSRETKQTDPRTARWGDMPSVELDAVPAPTLRALVQDCIERHLDPAVLAATRRIEKAEKDTLAEVRMNLVLGRNSEGGEYV